MEVKAYQSIKAFLDENLAFLETEEAVNNLLIGIPLSIQDDSTEINLVSVFNDERPVFCLVQTPPHNYLVYGEEAYLNDALELLIPYLKSLNISASGVIGKKETTIAFASIFEKYTQRNWYINFQQLIYQLDKLQECSVSPGTFRKATMEDLALTEHWFYNFSVEAMAEGKRSVARKNAMAKIESGMLYLWERGSTIVAMTAVARPTRHGITINYVYTPPEERGNGYAKSLVWFVSKEMLKKYKYCCLFTDIKNPASNKIYQKIGYYTLSEFREIRFTD